MRAGYDLCAEAYAAARSRDDSDQILPLLNALPRRSSVLDLGCGAGVPITLELARRHDVTGVDSSGRMLELARKTVPGASFVHTDILEADFAPGTFHAAVAIFVLFHLPREEQSTVFRRVWEWLRPGGYFLATLSEEAEGPVTEYDFFGIRMYRSSLGYQEYRTLLLEIGFELAAERIICRGYGRSMDIRDERYPMVLARKPLDGTPWRNG